MFDLGFTKSGDTREIVSEMTDPRGRDVDSCADQTMTLTCVSIVCRNHVAFFVSLPISQS